MIGIYCRVSTEQQAIEGLSLDIQREKGIKFALSLHENYTVYEDAGISGGTFDREQFQNLIQDIKQNKIDKVFVVSKDRLTRASLGEAISLRDFFRDKKVKLYVDGQLNALESPEDLLQSNILDSIAEFQRLLTRKKSKEGRQKQIDLGENSYCMIYGYDFTITKNGTKLWYINEEEAKLIRYIYQMYFEDLNFDQICRRLIAEGYKTKRKGTWDRGTISNILRRPEYIGLTPNTKGELIESKHYKPIMEKDVWERVQKTIDSKIRFRQGKYFRSASYDLSGILKCGKCGARFFYYSCPGRKEKKREAYSHKQLTPEQCSCTQTPFYVNRTIADYLMRAMFISTFEKLDDVQNYMAKLQADLGKNTQDITDSIKRVENQISALEKQRKRLVDAIRSGVLEPEDAREDMDKIRRETKVYQDSIDNLNRELLVKSAGTNEILNAFSEDIVKKLNSATENQRREMYGKFCKSILMFNYNLRVEYITEKALEVNIKNIPEDLMEQMIELKFYDLYPQEVKPEVNTLSDAIFASKPKKYYEVYNEIRETFILHTKGRPKKLRV